MIIAEGNRIEEPTLNPEQFVFHLALKLSGKARIYLNDMFLTYDYTVRIY